MCFKLRLRRLSSLNASKTISEKDRENLTKVLQTNEYISSEESDVASGPSDSKDDTAPKDVKILVKKKLPWRCKYLDDLFMELDIRTEKRRRWSQKGGDLSMKRNEGVKALVKSP